MERLLEEWLQLTLAECEAIQSAAWSRLKEAQAAKFKLRWPISETLAQWQRQGATGSGPAAHPFRVEVDKLLALEARNGELLAAQIIKTRGERVSRDQALHNLRKVRGSYARKPEAVWASYS